MTCVTTFIRTSANVSISIRGILSLIITIEVSIYIKIDADVRIVCGMFAGGELDHEIIKTKILWKSKSVSADVRVLNQQQTRLNMNFSTVACCWRVWCIVAWLEILSLRCMMTGESPLTAHVVRLPWPLFSRNKKYDVT